MCLYVFMQHVPNGILKGLSNTQDGVPVSTVSISTRNVPASTISFVTSVQGPESYSIHFEFISGYRLAPIYSSFFLSRRVLTFTSSLVRIKTCTP
jgi:hypothetical protein